MACYEMDKTVDAILDVLPHLRLTHELGMPNKRLKMPGHVAQWVQCNWNTHGQDKMSEVGDKRHLISYVL